MITILRKHHRWLMIVIAILAIPFVFYFVQRPDYAAMSRDSAGQIYGRTVSKVELQHNMRLLNLASMLGLSLSQDLALGATSEVEMYSEFTWNRLILRHEAKDLGIEATPAEIVEFVKTLPRFRGASGFDMSKYNEFTQTMLPSLGFTESQIEELAADQLALNRVKDLLGSGIQVPESESMENYKQSYGKLDVALVRLNSDDFAKEVKITDEDIAKYFEAHKAELKSEEKRRVEFVTFALTEPEKKLTGKERVEALQKVADHSNDFTQALLEKGANFGEVSKRFNVPVIATEEFTVATPAPQFGSNPQLTQYAFQLSTKEPYSDAIQGPDGFSIVHLLGVTEARPLSLEEAKPKIVEALKTERVRELVTNKGAQVAQQLREALKSGAPLEKAVQASGLKIERVPPFSLAENPLAKPDQPKEKNNTPDLPMIKNAVAELNPGDVTDFIPTEKGGLVALLEKREPVDLSGYEQAKTLFESRYLRGKRAIVFYEWLRDRRRVAGVETTGS